jgi:predicted SprT family Zn-dependent metalloprotease
MNYYINNCKKPEIVLDTLIRLVVLSGSKHNERGNTMNLLEAEKMAKELIDEHLHNEVDDPEWKFAFDNATRRFGACHWKTRRITLSRTLVILNDEKRVRNTTLHEIAHALAGARNGHNVKWKRTAQSIGCDAQRCYSTELVNVPPKKYTGTCSNCLRVIQAHRRNKIACGDCCRKLNHGRFTSDYLIKWI